MVDSKITEQLLNITETITELSKEVYKDGFQSATQELGGIGKTLVGYAHHVWLDSFKKKY